MAVDANRKETSLFCRRNAIYVEEERKSKRQTEEETEDGGGAGGCRVEIPADSRYRPTSFELTRSFTSGNAGDLGTSQLPRDHSANRASSRSGLMQPNLGRTVDSPRELAGVSPTRSWTRSRPAADQPCYRFAER